jgi:hypothetical protein
MARQHRSSRGRAGGITVIDTKRLAGKVEVRGRGERAELRVGRRDRSKLLDGVTRQLTAVSAAAEGVDVRAALCFVETSGLPLLRRLRPRGILLDGPRGVARLAKRAGPLDAAMIEELVARSTAGFPKPRDNRFPRRPNPAIRGRSAVGS